MVPQKQFSKRRHYCCNRKCLVIMYSVLVKSKVHLLKHVTWCYRISKLVQLCRVTQQLKQQHHSFTAFGEWRNYKFSMKCDSAKELLCTSFTSPAAFQQKVHREVQAESCIRLHKMCLHYFYPKSFAFKNLTGEQKVHKIEQYWKHLKILVQSYLTVLHSTFTFRNFYRMLSL